jgi:hypothetical protein
MIKQHQHCQMRQPTSNDGTDLGSPLIDGCDRPPTHRNARGRCVTVMCDPHAAYYKRWIGDVRPLKAARS